MNQSLFQSSDEKNRLVYIQTPYGQNIGVTSKDNFAQFIEQSQNNGINQAFLLEAREEGYCLVQSLNSGRYWDICGGSLEAGGQLIQWDKHGGPNQQFKFEHVGDGYFRIECRHSGLYLDIQGAQNQNDSLKQNPYHGGKSQLFKIIDIIPYENQAAPDTQNFSIYQGGSNIQIQTVNDLNFDIYGGSPNDQTHLIVWATHDGLNQRFTIEPSNNGYVFIKCQHSGKYLDINGAGQQDCAQVIQWPKHGGYNQQFRLEHVQDGLFRIRCRHSQKFLDVAGGGMNQGDSVIQFSFHGGLNQLFKINEL